MRGDVNFDSLNDFGLTVAVGFFASIMLTIIASGMMGNEYSWNTLRPLVARARTRVSLLSAKVVALIIYSVVFVAVLVLAVVAMYFVGSWIVDVPSGFSMGVLGDGFVFAMKQLFTQAPIIALAFMLATVFRSNAAGIAGALGLSFVEEPIWMLLGFASDVFEKAKDWGIAANVSALSGFTDDISQGRAAAVLTAYTVAFVGITFAVFTRRDVTSG